ncbi:MAG: hypothetical protein QM831_30200 [Kofleriaceae bacterium]
MSAKHLDRNYKRMAWLVSLTALLVTFIYGAVASSRIGAFALVLVSMAALAIGGFVGFLFGLPKAVAETADSPRKHAYTTNTNLEQVSDWLTKILVGLGLSQLAQLPDVSRGLGDYVSTVSQGVSPAVVVALLISFAILGFIAGFLVTKFDLGDAIDEHDGLLDIVRLRPDDRDAVEALMLSSLYKAPPSGYKTAIDTGESFLGQEGHPSQHDANVFGYLACAYGQKYSNATSDADKKSARLAVIDNANDAIVRDPSWAAKLRGFANPPVNGVDDDLSALKDDKELKDLLENRVSAVMKRDVPPERAAA